MRPLALCALLVGCGARTGTVAEPPVDPCAGTVVRLGGAGSTFTPLQDGDTVQWEAGPNGGWFIWTGFLARGFRDDDYVLVTMEVLAPDAVEPAWSSAFCVRFDDLKSFAGWRGGSCYSNHWDPERGPPGDGPVNLRITIRDGIEFDPGHPSGCHPLDTPHCEAHGEVSVHALAPIDWPPPACDPP